MDADYTARTGIADASARFSRGADRLDAELLRSAFHKDATDEHPGQFVGPAMEFVDYIIPYLEERDLLTQHALFNSFMERSGREAFVETYFMVVMIRRSAKDGPAMSRFHGRYADIFTERDGEWRILHRTAIIDAIAPDTFVTPTGVTRAGSGSGSDISYEIRERWSSLVAASRA